MHSEGGGGRFLASTSRGFSQGWSHAYINDVSLYGYSALVSWDAVGSENWHQKQYLQREDVKAALHVEASPATAWDPPAATVDRFDSHAIIKQLAKAGGFGEPQAEAIVASALTSMTRAGVVARNELERELMHGRAETQALKQEVASSLREASASMKHSTETLQAENEKLRADLKYNIDRITQSQKLDLNLEKGRLRELHGIQESQMKEVEARVDRELHQMRTQIEAAKTEIIRYSVGTLVSLGALSLAAIRLVM